MLLIPLFVDITRIIIFNLFYVSDSIENRERQPKSLAQFATLSKCNNNFSKIRMWTDSEDSQTAGRVIKDLKQIK